ncbi:MAG: NUDIX hydrolase [Pirellulales bacterium]
MDDTPEVLFDGKLFRVVRKSFSTSWGQPLVREWVDHPGAVTVVPMLDGDRVCLIRNRRHAVGKTLIELPAGTRDHGEDPAETARRELIEETGFVPGRIEHVTAFFMSPGILNERMELYRATDLVEGPPARETGEEIENLIVTWDEAMAMIRRGEILDAKTLTGLLLCQPDRRQ